MRIGERIKELRLAHGMTQEELSQVLKMNRCILNRIELGTRAVRDDEVKMFADHFNVSADYLLNTKYKISSASYPPSSGVINRFLSLAKKATPQNIQIATNVLEQLNKGK